MVASQYEGIHEPAWYGWTRQYASALVGVGRFDDAERFLDELSARSVERDLPLCLAEISVVQGDLAVARQRRADARVCYQRALSLDPAGLSPYAHALAQMAYGRFLRKAGERRAATEQLMAARSTLAQLRAQPALTRCHSELSANGVAVEKPETRLDPRLTPQEGAVARLVCTGLTNREVATELVLSVKTVSYHLGNVFAKVGVNSRTQLVARLGSVA